MSALTLEQKKANRKLWVDALRSGDYEQCKGSLHDGNGYCCLGVLAKIAGCELVQKEGGFWFDGEGEFAPEKAMEFVGLSTASGEFGAFVDALASRNDLGAEFEKIADIIESEPEGLFDE